MERQGEEAKCLQTAYELSMKDWDIDSYTDTFDRLAAATGWEPNAEGTIE